jgi:hypothetical protein
MNSENRLEQIAGMSVLLLLVVGCFVVLRPFVSALLLALILSYSTWPIYAWLERLLKGRRGLAAILMTLLVAAVFWCYGEFLLSVAQTISSGPILSAGQRSAFCLGFSRSAWRDGCLWLSRFILGAHVAGNRLRDCSGLGSGRASVHAFGTPTPECAIDAGIMESWNIGIVW